VSLFPSQLHKTSHKSLSISSSAVRFSPYTSLAAKLRSKSEMLKRLTARVVLVCLLPALSSFAQDEKSERVDLDAINKIRYEGFRHSKVMEIASGLMDGIGPRLTGSPNMKRANEWT